jgi:hypothetical protein
MSQKPTNIETHGTSKKITEWGASFISELMQFNWFTVLAAVSTGVVFGSFMVMTIQALWWNNADVLLPMKVAIPMGYGVILFHMFREFTLCFKKHQAGPALIATIEFIMFFGSIFALKNTILGFYGQEVHIGLGEAILPFEVRVVVTLSLILPIVFLFVATLAFIYFVAIGKVVSIFVDALRGRTSQS